MTSPSTSTSSSSSSFTVGMVELDTTRVKKEREKDLASLDLYWRATNFLSAAQIFLKDNVLLREGPLETKHVKPRLLGHWGTCPGINLVYAHLSRMVRDHNFEAFLVTGPGHGAPANLSNLYLEGAVKKFYPQYTDDAAGLSKFIRAFSWPGGFPSHVNAEIPGTIHEGGELGYALSVSFGAVMDNPDLIVTCIVGDGEAETGPTATAWHSYKFIDPAESGAVLPVLHLNGYKISQPTIYGTMSHEELTCLFSGYGYQVRFVENCDDIHADLYVSMEWALGEIKKIQTAARAGKPLTRPKWPMLILRTPKGWTGPKELDGLPVEGTFRAHQVPIKDAGTNNEHLKLLDGWLRSYKVDELFDEEGRVRKEVRAILPERKMRIGLNRRTVGKGVEFSKDLVLPAVESFGVKVESEKRGQAVASNTWELGVYLTGVIENNPKSFRIFSPDELESNKLHAVFKKTHRNYQWPVDAKAKVTDLSNKGGRVIEMLSEHTLQGFMQGYVLTHRFAIFPSYEAFLGIIATMMDQYSKFLKMAFEVSWRSALPSLNYIESSTLWRQEHNGFSHQNPGFINTLLNKKSNMIRIYFPPDANSLIATMEHVLHSRNYINLVVASKQETAQWLTMEEAVAHCRSGASVWHWCSTDEGKDPDVVLCGIGCETMYEVVAAAAMLRKDFPALRIRVVNVTDLLILDSDRQHQHRLSSQVFNSLFTHHKPVIINFHGYPSAVKQLLFGRGASTNQKIAMPTMGHGPATGAPIIESGRFFINGYIEEGTTTTPFKMLVANRCSRFHLAMQAIMLSSSNENVAPWAIEKMSHFEYILKKHEQHITDHGADPEGLYDKEQFEIFGRTLKCEHPHCPDTHFSAVH